MKRPAKRPEYAGPIAEDELEALLLDGEEKLMKKVVERILVRDVLEMRQAWMCPWLH